MKTTRRRLPWSLIAASAVAGATFAGVANYVNQNRSQPLEPDVAPVAIQDVTPPPIKDSDPKGTDNQNANEPVRQQYRATSSDLNTALHQQGFDSARVIGLDVENGLATVDMNAEIVDTLGSTGEAELLGALKSKLSKDRRINSFQIRIEGKIEKSLGHTDISSPIATR